MLFFYLLGVWRNFSGID